MNKLIFSVLTVLAVGNSAHAMDQFLNKSNSQQQIMALQAVGTTSFAAGVIAGIKNQMIRAKLLGIMGIGAGLFAKSFVELADARLNAFTHKEKIYNAFGVSTDDQRVTGLIIGSSTGATAGAFMSLAKTRVRPLFGVGLIAASTSAIASAKAMIVK